MDGWVKSDHNQVKQHKTTTAVVHFELRKKNTLCEVRPLKILFGRDSLHFTLDPTLHFNKNLKSENHILRLKETKQRGRAKRWGANG